LRCSLLEERRSTPIPHLLFQASYEKFVRAGFSDLFDSGRHKIVGRENILNQQRKKILKRGAPASMGSGRQ
jgi:hypothetical protein